MYETLIKHGHAPGKTKSPTYTSWDGMIQRCTNPHNLKFSLYGGRGITVCDRWRIFTHFLADMGERPSGLTLDRINVDGNYEPGNCRWATASEQRRNTRQVLITHCLRGHEYTPENTGLQSNGTARYCRACANTRARIAWAKR